MNRRPNRSRARWLLACALGAVLFLPAAGAPPQAVGVFESHGDIGVNPKPGSIEYDPPTGEYRVTGGGANIWGSVDAFQFAWKRLSGDMTLSADVHFIGAGKVEHRKAVLMIRQSLDPDSAYADVALHGSGLTSLQFRRAKGAQTEEIQSSVQAPLHLRLERRGNRFMIYVGKPGGQLTPGGPVTVGLQDPVYAGIGVCSHDADALETAVFSNVKVEAVPRAESAPRYRSRITIYNLKSRSTRVVYTADEVMEAPNWSPDGKSLLVSAGGGLYRIAVAGGSALERLNVDPSYRCNNDKVYSPDGRKLAMSCSTPRSGGSQVFLAAADGSNAKRMVAETPSYFHGWSPDGRWLAFVGERDHNFDLFRVPAAGGPADRLTSSPAYDDGPDYSPDGRWIYFNSNRSAGWDIWRMPASGAGPNDARAERVTSDEWEDWFPHPSPDGLWLVFLSFPAGTAGHDDRRDGVRLRMIPLPGATLDSAVVPKVLETFFGGQGTINVNSWSPDSQEFAFVVYEPLP